MSYVIVKIHIVLVDFIFSYSLFSVDTCTVKTCFYTRSIYYNYILDIDDIDNEGNDMSLLAKRNCS